METETAGGPGQSGASAPPASALPCLSVTTASDEASPTPLPGPRKKQAEALTKNIQWMSETFGKERIGFLTLTVGDKTTGGKFWNLRDRKEAQRRFHSLLTNAIAKRYQCGVVVTERHKNRGIHFHLAIVCKEDIRGQIDFGACFPPKDSNGKRTCPPDYSSANQAIKSEWAYWRRTAKRFGFGWHQLQPMRENGHALGRYLGKYLSKDWSNRLPEDKGARCVRYFGHWSNHPRGTGERKEKPPNKGRFGWLTVRSRVWREMVKQTIIVLNHGGAKLTPDNIKNVMGPRWGWKMAKLFPAVAFISGDWQPKEIQDGIEAHNLEVRVRWLADGGDPARQCWWYVTELNLDHFRPSPAWIKANEELELAKECEAIMQRGLNDLAKRQRKQKEKMRMLREVAELFKMDWPEGKN
jgi:hypothetical protein